MPLPQAELRDRAAGIRLALFDVDGVLSDGRLYLAEDGTELRTSHVRDGHGLKLLTGAGLQTGIISGRPAGGWRKRAARLGMQHLYFETGDKIAVLESLLEQSGLHAEQVSFMGDDTPDLGLIRRCGLGMAVADAHPDVLAAADWVSDLGGGQGAVRQACDLLLASRGAP